MSQGNPLVSAYYKWNTPRARWQEVHPDLVGMFSPNYRRKYVYLDGTEVIRNVNEELFDDNGKIKELDDSNG